MSREEIAETTYEAMIGLNRLKADVGVTGPDAAGRIESGLNLARDVMRRIDGIIASTNDKDERERRYGELRSEMEDAERATNFAKKDLRMPGMAGIRLMGALKYLMRRAGLMR